MRTEIKTILLLTDFSEKSANALNVAAEMTKRHGAKLIVSHMVHTYYLIDRGGKQVIGSETVQQIIDRSKVKLEELQSEVNEVFNITIETKISTQNIIDTVNDFVLTDNIDIVVMGTAGRQNIKQFLLGSNSYNVLLHANCSVLLIPEKSQKTSFRKILFPVRVRHELHQKADLCVLLANKNNGGIDLLGVAEYDRMVQIKYACAEMEKNLFLKSADYVAEFQLCTDTAEMIAKAAKEKDSDIIILADEDEHSWKSFMADNFFKKMINGTDIPLLIVKSKLKKINNDPDPISAYDLSMPIPG